MMKKSMILGTAAASSSSFCGCGDCSLDWKDGSEQQQSILLGLTCSNFVTLMKQGTVPAVTVSDGEACTSLLSDINGATVMGQQASDFLGPNSTCPDGLSVHLDSEKESNDGKIMIDLYYESQCPGCRQMITESFAEAFKADGFLNMANVNFWPYGNAHEKQTSSGSWDFTCQHGTQECQYNFLETCAKSLVACPVQYFNFLNCVEKSDTTSDYSGVASKCGTEAQIGNMDQVMACFTSSDKVALEHEIAVKTDALNPPHKWVPWVTVNDVYDEKVQDLIGDNLLKYVCDNYKGADKSKDCPPSGMADKKPAKIDVCLREATETAFL